MRKIERTLKGKNGDAVEANVEVAESKPKKTLLECLGIIVEKTSTGSSDTDRTFNPNVYVDAKEEIDRVCETLGTTPREAMIFSNILEQSCGGRVEGRRVAKSMGITYVKFLTYEADQNSLAQKKLIRKNEDGEIIVPSFIKDALAQNKAYELENYSDLDTDGVLNNFKKIFNQREKDEICEDELMDEIDLLMEAGSKRSPFVQECAKLGFKGDNGVMSYYDRLLFYTLVYHFVFNDDDMVRWDDIERILEKPGLAARRLKVRFQRNELKVAKNGIIEPLNEDGVKSQEFFHISDSVKDVIFAEIGGSGSKSEATDLKILKSETIVRKDLFYNSEEGEQVGRLRNLLDQDNFKKTCKRLKEKGLRSGFSCLFYGVPGTGKTETAYQLAKQTGRDLILVNVPDIKSCWVGESEKNIQGLFDRYRNAVERSSVAPILLFNEADAIFGIRQEGATRSVDKMENSIQNIILQEMEKLDGILIATTNLTTNLDKAFERRFLYKVRFDKPGVEVKEKIWCSMLPSLSVGQAKRLSDEFDFSGGQIENIVRKKEIRYIIDGVEAGFKEIRSYCLEEMIDDSGRGKRKIGFR